MKVKDILMAIKDRKKVFVFNDWHQIRGYQINYVNDEFNQLVAIGDKNQMHCWLWVDMNKIERIEP